MLPATEQIYDAAAALPEEEQFELIEALMANADRDGGPPFDEAWRETVSRRSAEIDAGTAKLIPWSDVKARMLRKLNAD